MLDRVDVYRGCTDNVLALDVLQLEYSLVFMIKRGFIKYCDTEVFLGAIRLGHLKEGIHLADSWNKVRYERLKLGLKINLLGLVSSDVFEEFFDLARDRQVDELDGIIRTWDFLLVVVILVIFCHWLLLL